MLRRILKIIALPLTVLGLFALLYAVWVMLGLPPERTIIEIAKPYLDRYGAVLLTRDRGREWELDGRATAVSLAAAAHDADAVLLQYNPFSYGRWGFAPSKMNHWMVVGRK